MKKLLLYLFIFLYHNSAFSQDWTYDKNNNVHRFSSDVGFLLKSDNKVLFFLTDFIENDVSEYYIKAWTYLQDLGNYSFPYNGKLLFETFDGATVELEAALTEMENGMPVAYYPISNEQLDKIFQGVHHIKIDLLIYKSKKNVIRNFSQKKYGKDTLGEYFKKSFEVIENEKKKGYYRNYL